MKIINLSKQSAYELKPDTKIEVERTNPFFNEYGEQSVPLSIPSTDHNRLLLGLPDQLGRRGKMEPQEVAIADGDYYQQCRQYVLSAQYKGDISTSFYLNDGSFYSRIQNVKLKDVFGEETVPNVSTVEQAIQFCRNLRTNTDPHFTIFPLLLTDDSGLDTGFNFKILNAYGKEKTLASKEIYSFSPTPRTVSVDAFDPMSDGAGCDFYNAVQRTEYIGEIPITLAPGYYISPFIRANYVLQRVFQRFGYTLSENFFTQTAPFSTMALLNKVIDTLVNGHIYLADLVPDVTVSDFLAMFRKKFCCEFSVNEGTRTVGVVFLKDIVDAPAQTDLSGQMTSRPNINYKSDKDFKRVSIQLKDVLDTDLEDTYDDLDALMKANSGAYFDVRDGCIYKDGWSGNFKVKTKVAEASMPYNTGESAIEAQEIKSTDVMPEFRELTFTGEWDGENVTWQMQKVLYVGDYVTLNSKMIITGEDNQETTADYQTQPLMLAFCHINNNAAVGTISAYNIYNTEMLERISNYALYFYGEDGLFNRFYRPLDTLYRNAMQETKVNLLLSNAQKQHLTAYDKVLLHGVPYFFQKLKFTLGGKSDPVESELLSLQLLTPTYYAKNTEEQFPIVNAEYKWVGHITEEQVTQSQYEQSGLDRERTFQTIYPPIPSADYANQHYAEQVSYTKQMIRHGSFWRHAKYAYTKTTVWLECVPIEQVDPWWGA